MNSPKVSIIIPVYNKEKYIRKTLASVIDQPFQDFELIIINDGSTDKSREIIAEYQYKDSRIKVIDIPNGGVSNARNVGLKHAKGEWIQFLDGDDVLMDDYLSHIFASKSDEDIDIIFSGIGIIDIDYRIKDHNILSLDADADKYALCDLFVEYQNATGYFGFISNKLIRNNLIKSANASFPVNIKLAEDLCFFSQLYPFISKVRFIPVISFCYMQTESEHGLANLVIDYYSQLIVRLEIKKWFEKTGKYTEHKRFIDHSISQYVYYALYYENESGRDLQTVFMRIANDESARSSLSLIGMNRFERKIIQAVINRDYNRLCDLFQRRNAIRFIYRKVLRHE